MAVMAYPTTKNGCELSRLLTAAVINQKFRKLLLADPAIALASGFNGEPFHLASEDKNRVLSISAKSLADFAMQLTDRRLAIGQRSSLHGLYEGTVVHSFGLD
jgi:hypothetical protein